MRAQIILLTIIAELFLTTDVPAQDAGNVIPFQGQLANQAGQPLSPSSASTLVFRLYRQAIGGIAIWEESQPNISVNAGRFSVLLGSRTKLPDAPNFNATLYLGITVDDGDPSTADVEMRPRQAIVPVINAAYARNSDKLRGYDWSVLFGSEDPAVGKLSGEKLALDSVPTDRLEGDITSEKILDGTITAIDIATNAIPELLQQGVVGTVAIASNAVTFEKLAPRQIVTTNASAGQIAVSQVVNISSPGDLELPQLTLTLETTGRPVMVVFTSAETTAPTFIRRLNNPTVGVINVKRDSVVVRQFYIGDSAGDSVYYPPGGFSFIDLDVPPGSHTYKVTIDRIEVLGLKLVVFEL